MGTWYPNRQVCGGQVRLLQKKKIDMILGTSTGCCKFPFEDTFKILGCAMDRQWKTYDAVEERMQSANKACWKDILMYKSKNVRNVQDWWNHVYAASALESENWSWTLQTMEKIKGWETNGQAIVQGDEGPVSEVAQGVQVHGVAGVRHGERKRRKVK